MELEDFSRPPCGALLPDGIRAFCRSAACGTCVRHACRRRARLFASRCGPSAKPWVSFTAPLGGTPFWLWRKRRHDLLDQRRQKNPIWKNFGLIARWDGRDDVYGTACLADLGSRDLVGLLNCREVRALEQNDADAISQVLLTMPVSPMPGSLKNIFLTINPRSGSQPAARSRPAHHCEPMPFIF